MRQPILSGSSYVCSQTGQQVDPEEEASAREFRKKMEEILKEKE
jgi:hypothetical protein